MPEAPFQERAPVVNKVTSPRLFRVVPRRRLFEKLDEAGHARAIWVTGPAGAGKSTLVASYLAERPIACVWYRMDADDADPATFFYYLGMAVDQASELSYPRLPLLTPEYLSDIDTFAIRYFEKLGQRFTGPAWVVFDNFQDLPVESLVPRIVHLAVEHLDPGIKLAILSRSDPGSGTARAQANRLMSVIDWSHLAFTVEEYRQVLALLDPDPEAVRQAEAMQRLTGGWIAGLLLWLQQSPGSRPAPQVSTEQPPARIFDYFASEVLDKLEPQIGRFLLQASFLLEMTAENAARLTGLSDAGEILESFYRRNFFLERRMGMRTHYQFHPLFRNFLQSRACMEFPSQALRTLRCSAAAIMADSGMWDEAVNLYRQAEAWDKLTELIALQAPALTAQGRLATLSVWLNQLPPAVGESRPLLVYWKGVSLMITDPQSGQRLCTRAFDAFKDAEDIWGQVMSWSTVVDSFFFMRGSFQELDRWIEEGIRVGELISAKDDANLFSRFCAGMIGALLVRSPTHAAFARWQQKSEEMLGASIDPQTLAAMCNMLAWSYCWLGQVKKARALREALGPLITGFSIDPTVSQLWQAQESLCVLWEGRPLKSLQIAESALQKAHYNGIHICDLLLISSCILGNLVLDELAAAQSYLEKMRSRIAPNAAWDWAHFHFLSACAACLSENVPEAGAHLDWAMELVIPCGTPLHYGLTAIGRAQILLESGKIPEAQAELDRVVQAKLSSASVTLKFLYGLTAAELLWKQNRMQDGFSHLRRAFSLAAENGLYSICGIKRTGHSVLCALALEAGIEPEFVVEFIRRNRLHPPPLHAAGESWPFEVKVQILGRFNIIRGKQAIDAAFKKVPKKPFELLHLLISAGPQGLTREAAGDRLWPDADGDRAHQNMNTTLHRLRRILGDNKAVAATGGRLALSSRHCRVDAWCFEASVAHAFAAEGLAARTERLQKALALYTGRFSADAAAFSIGYAKRLDAQFTRAVLELGRLLTGSGQLAAAVSVFQDALRTEETSEPICHALLSLLEEMGQCAEAIRRYARFRKVLRSRARTEPGIELRSLYQKMRDRARR